jgi:hypothetical protein
MKAADPELLLVRLGECGCFADRAVPNSHVADGHNDAICVVAADVARVASARGSRLCLLVPTLRSALRTDAGSRSCVRWIERQPPALWAFLAPSPSCSRHGDATLQSARFGVKDACFWGSAPNRYPANPHGYAPTAFRQTLLVGGG